MGWSCLSATKTKAECEAACNANSDCYGYDRMDAGANSEECCLFKKGSTGNGTVGRACFTCEDCNYEAKAPKDGDAAATCGSRINFLIDKGSSKQEAEAKICRE